MNKFALPPRELRRLFLSAVAVVALCPCLRSETPDPVLMIPLNGKDLPIMVKRPNLLDAIPSADSAEYKRIAAVVQQVAKATENRVAISAVYLNLAEGNIAYFLTFADRATAAKDLAALAADFKNRKGERIGGVFAGGYNQPGGLGPKDLALLAEQPELRELQLWGCDLGDGFKSLARMKRLENLALCQCRSSDARLDFLAELPLLRNLRLEGLPLDAATFGNLKSLTRLTSLSLDNTSFDDAGALALKDLVNLRFLNANGTKVTDAGTAHWAKLVNLELIGLSNTAVTDKTLESIKDATELSSINLNGTKVTGVGFKHLGRMPKLFNFGVRDTPLDGEELIRNAKSVSGSGKVMINTGGTQLTADQVRRYAELREYGEFFTPAGGLIESRNPAPEPKK